nr:hypothetical protein [Martelella alba]
MLAFQPVEPVDVAADIAGIEGLGEDFRDALLGDDAGSGARKGRAAFEEALDLGLRLEAASGIALEGLADDGRQRFLRNKDFSAPLDRDVLIADRGIVNPVAVFHAGAHLLGDLPAVLLAFQRPLGGNDGFDELAFRCLVEAEVEAFDRCLPGAEGIAQIEMETGVAGKALEIVEDDDEALVRLGVEKAEQGLHARTFHEVDAAGDRVGKDGGNLVALCRRMLAAAGLLAFKAVTVRFLPLRRDPAIDHGLCRLFVRSGHHSCSSSSRISSGSAFLPVALS